MQWENLDWKKNMQDCVLKATGANSNITNILLDLNTNKGQTATYIRKDMEFLAILDHVNAIINHIVGCLDS